MGKKQVNLKENAKILAKRRKMAAHIKEMDPKHRKLKFGAFLRKYGRVLIGGGIILAVVFCAVFAGVLTEWDPEKTNISEAKLKPNSMGEMTYWFGVDKDEKEATDRFQYQLTEEDGKTAVTEISDEGVYRLSMTESTETEEIVTYLTTKKSGGKLKATETLYESAEFRLEAAGDGYHLYVESDEGKSYVNIQQSGNKSKVSFGAEAVTVYTFNAENALLANVVEARNETVKTKVQLCQNANRAYVSHFYTADGEQVNKPEAGVAYKMGVIREDKSATVVYYLTGAKSGQKLSTTTDITQGADFMLEEAEEGDYLTVQTAKGKSYVNVTVKMNRTKISFGEQPLSTFKMNNSTKSLTTTVVREHVFGTDIYGRDMWSRLIFGSRNTLIVSLGAQVILTVSGTLLGLLCGYYTKVEKYLMRVLDAMATIPNLLLCLLMVSVFGSGVPNLMLAMSFHGIPGLARMVRNQVLSLREKEYIESEKAMGASDIRTVILHILPACMSYLLVRFSTGLSGAILSMTSLSYLGVGLDPTIASWGGMIQNSQKIMFALPHTFMVPTIAIGITVFGFSMLGDGLRDLLDPKLR